jgi:hypothetical protein
LIHFPLQLTIAIAAMAGGFALPVGQPWFLLAYLGATLVLGVGAAAAGFGLAGLF